MSVALNRPRQQNRFTVVGTQVAAPSPRLSSTITVASSTGFATGNLVQIMLDSGENFRVQISGIAGLVWTLLNPLPASVGTLYGDPIENSILRLDTNTFIQGPFLLDTAQGVLGVNTLG